MPTRRRRRSLPPPVPIELLLDVHDDLHVLRAVEAFAWRRRGAIVVRPTPGCQGSRTLCQDILDASRLPTSLRQGRPWGSAREQTVARLRRARVRELWVLRAQTFGGGGWIHLGLAAAAAGARLALVIHAPWPCPHKVAGLRVAGLPVAAPQVIRLTRDTLSLALGIAPIDAAVLDAPAPVRWLPEVPRGWQRSSAKPVSATVPLR